MPISDANPELYKSIRDSEEAYKNKLFYHTFGLYGGCLFSSESDLIKLCSSGADHSDKITKLQDFDTYALFLTRLNWNRSHNILHKEDMCLNINLAADATKGLYDLLHRNLEALYEESSSSSTIQKSRSIEDANKRIKQMLVKADMEDDDDDAPAVEDDPYTSVLHGIDHTDLYYWRTEANDEAHELLGQILRIEKMDTVDDFFVSKKRIEDQIKLVEELPVEKLELQLDRLIKEIAPLSDNHVLFLNVRDRMISDTCAAMRRERDAFMTKYAKTNELDSNDLDNTLASLVEKVHLFEKQWEDEFARFFISEDETTDLISKQSALRLKACQRLVPFYTA